MMHLLVLTLRVVLPADHLVLGQGGEVQLAIEGARGTPHLVTNVGQLGTPSETGGRWRVTWTPPAERYPQVAMFGVWDDADTQLALLPLWGAAILPVQADETNADITLELPGHKFSGHTDAQGRAQIPFVAPPGIDKALVSGVDRLGNVSAKLVPLGIPDGPRVIVDAPAHAYADGKTTAVVRVFAAAADGAPEPSLVVEGARETAPGVRVLELPGRTELGEQKVIVRAGKQTREAVVRWVPGPPSAIEAHARPSAEDGTWLIDARVIDTAARTVPAQLSASAAAGALERTAAADGLLETRFRPTRAEEPGEIVFSAGDIQQRLAIGPEARGPFRWVARLISTSNLSHAIANGLLVGADLPVQARVGLSAQTGILYASGKLPMGAADTPFSYLAVPFRLGVDLALLPPETWQPYLGIHGGVDLLSASLGSAGETELILDAGAEIGLRYRWGPGTLVVTVGWTYGPVISGSLLSGSQTGLTETLGYRY